MNKERYNQIIDEVYENYLGGGHIKWLKPREYDTPMGKINVPTLYSKEELVEKCKTDPDFSERWGLKIEERELGLEERGQWCQDFLDWDLVVGNLDHDHIREDVEENAPTKLITVTYKDEKIEVYE